MPCHESTIVTQYQMEGVGHLFSITPNKFPNAPAHPLLLMTSQLTSFLCWGNLFNSCIYEKKLFTYPAFKGYSAMGALFSLFVFSISLLIWFLGS